MLTRVVTIFPGLALAASISAVALWLEVLMKRGVSALVFALAIGCVLGKMAKQGHGFSAGFAFASGPMLRMTVVFMGSLVTIDQVLGLGSTSLIIAIAPLVITLVFTVLCGRLFGMDSAAITLVAVGTSICGASAILAANSILNARAAQVAIALAAITILGSAGMVVLPSLAGSLGLSLQEAGLWYGAALHEVAQVAGAAAQAGEESVAIATVAKFARILSLAPVLVIVSSFSRLQPVGIRRTAFLPWFVVGFIAMAAAKTASLLPIEIEEITRTVLVPVLGTTLAAIGAQVDVSAFGRDGRLMLILATFGTLVIASISLLFILML